MANEYSVKIHRYIFEKIAAAEEKKARAQKEAAHETRKFYEGQLHELLNLKMYLKEKIDLVTQQYG